jgi:DNA-binding NarL/FixJ family response regulator
MSAQPGHTPVVHQTTVMIVDSHPVLCEALTTRLAEEPDLRVVATASSSTGLVELVAMHRPQVLVLDAELGEANGGAVIRQIRTTQPATAIVMLTPNEDADSAAHAMRMGATAFVLKVAPVQDLLTAIRWAGQGEMWMSPPLLTSLFNEVRSRTNGERTGSRLSQLTQRELEVLELLVEGLSHAAIAKRLHLAVNTVRTHTHNLQTKLNVHSNLAAVSVALDEGLRPK